MIALLFIIALLSPAPIDRTVTVVFVEPIGEQLTADEQHEALTAIRDAAAWWEALSPIPTQLRIGATLFVTTTEDAFAPLPMAQSDGLTIAVIDNTNSQHLFPGGAGGLALAGRIWLIDTTPALIAHEIGHAVYGLLHPTDCTRIDLMCYTMQLAYGQRFIGCQSRAALGYPCRSTYLPFMEIPHGVQ